MIFEVCIIGLTTIVVCGKLLPQSMNKALLQFGTHLKELRLAAGFSLREICQKVRYDASNWSKIERGRISPPSDNKVLEDWALALGLAKQNPKFEEFITEASVAQGIIPTGVMNDEEMLSFLPAFFRTIKNKKSTKEDVDRLIELIKNL